MPVSANFIEYVLDQLHSVGAVRSRRMFGGIGLYSGDLFFGLIADDCVYFKVDDSNRSDYVSRGCEQFRPLADDPNAVSMNYYRLPEEVLEDVDEVKGWAHKSLRVAAAASAAKAVRRQRKPPAKQAKPKAKRSKKR
jgi:DNA transformation protein and related proteins